jgi:hypothetical protein
MLGASHLVALRATLNDGFETGVSGDATVKTSDITIKS